MHKKHAKFSIFSDFNARCGIDICRYNPMPNIDNNFTCDLKQGQNKGHLVLTFVPYFGILLSK